MRATPTTRAARKTTKEATTKMALMLTKMMKKPTKILKTMKTSKRQKRAKQERATTISCCKRFMWSERGLNPTRATPRKMSTRCGQRKAAPYVVSGNSVFRTTLFTDNFLSDPVFATILFNNQQASALRNSVAYTHEYLLNGSNFQLYIAQLHDANGDTTNLAIDGIVQTNIGNQGDDVSLGLNRAAQKLSILYPQLPLAAICCDNAAANAQPQQQNVPRILCMHHLISKVLRQLLMNQFLYNNQQCKYETYVATVAGLNIPDLCRALHQLRNVRTRSEKHYASFANLAESNVFQLLVALLPADPISRLLSLLGKVHNSLNQRLTPQIIAQWTTLSVELRLFGQMNMAATAENYILLFRAHPFPIRPSVLTTRPSYAIHNYLNDLYRGNPSSQQVVTTWLNFGSNGFPERILRCGYGFISMTFQAFPPAVANFSFTPVQAVRCRAPQFNAVPSLRTIAFSTTIRNIVPGLRGFPLVTIVDVMTQMLLVSRCTLFQTCLLRSFFMSNRLLDILLNMF